MQAVQGCPAASERRGFGRLRRGLMMVMLAGSIGAIAPSVASASVSYVAMGDSYTSGPGIAPASPTAPADCGQSAINYPHLAASALNLALTDVSCGGAKTENFTVAQHEDQPPQFDALTPTTEVVSLGMGGNDGNLFGTLLQRCTEIDLNNPPPKSAPCQEQYEGFVNQVAAEFKKPQEEALAEIHVLSPKAKVFVVGYPEVTPLHGSCYAQIPWTAGDLKWFNHTVQRRGNAQLKAEAKANNAIFVETFKPSKGHNLCEPIGTRWIEPLFGSLTGVPVHPNALGEQNDAYDLEQAMLNNGVR